MQQGSDVAKVLHAMWRRILLHVDKVGHRKCFVSPLYGAALLTISPATDLSLRNSNLDLE